MSLRWLLLVVCDNCGRLSETRSTRHDQYGLTARALRSTLRESGWTSRTPDGPVGHRDHCPNCSEGRP